MKQKPINPYTKLLHKIKEFCFNIKYPYLISMWFYEKNSLKTTQWKLLDLYERAAAAEQLGYEVIIAAEDDGLNVYYRKKLIFHQNGE